MAIHLAAIHAQSSDVIKRDFRQAALKNVNVKFTATDCETKLADNYSIDTSMSTSLRNNTIVDKVLVTEKIEADQNKTNISTQHDITKNDVTVERKEMALNDDISMETSEKDIPVDISEAIEDNASHDGIGIESSEKDILEDSEAVDENAPHDIGFESSDEDLPEDGIDDLESNNMELDFDIAVSSSISKEQFDDFEKFDEL